MSEPTIENDSSQPASSMIASISTELVQNSSETNDAAITAKEEISSKIENSSNLSKNQLKKLRKKERWQSVKAERRKEEKQRKKRRLQEARERGEEIVSRKRFRYNKMASSSCKLRIAIDCSFDEMMVERDIFKLINQIRRSYAVNRRSANPVQFYVTGLSGRAKQRIDQLGGTGHWDFYLHEEDYMNVFKLEDIVYLTAESPNVLDELNESDVYIIGGLVDHNSKKGHCHQVACSRGLRHARLPLDEHVTIHTRRVLTVDHVFEILLQRSSGTSWPDAFMAVLPKRKGAELKSPGAECDAEEDEEEEGEEEELEEEEEDGDGEEKNGSD